MVKISIIVPVYNVEEYLSKCLDSLVNQTFDSYEVIVVNDGSPDSSQNIIDEYVKKYPELIKSYVKENGGQASARNFGLTKAGGEYIVYVDSDDYVDETILEKLYNKTKNDDSDIVVCAATSIAGDKTNLMDDYSSLQADLFKEYILARPSAWCRLIKKEILINEKLKFLENHYYEDVAVVPAWCLFCHNISFLNESLYYYLVRQGSTMNQLQYTKKLEDIFDSLENLSSIFKFKECYETYFEEIEFIYIEHLLHAASLRFLPFEEGRKSLDRIASVMEKEFPKWRQNKYYKNQNIKYKIICNLFYKRKYNILKKILKIK